MRLDFLPFTLGFDHRPVKGCVMSDVEGKAIALADASTGHYCGICRSYAEAGVLKPQVFPGAAPLVG
jgi:hypothetical protein